MSEVTKPIKLPKPMRIVWGSLSCCWLAGIMNPGFYSIGAMLTLMIPVLVIEHRIPRQSDKTPSKNSV